MRKPPITYFPRRRNNNVNSDLHMFPLLGILNLITAQIVPPQPINYYVSAGGTDTNDGLSVEKPFKSVQKAANLTKPGDTVNIMDGVYFPGSNWVTLHIKNSGTADKPITYKAYPGAKPKLKPSPTGSWHIIFIESASYISIEGLELEGNNQNVILSYAQSQASNGNNTLTNGSCLSIDGRKVTNKPTHITILNNKIHDCGGAGISAIQSDYITVDKNEIFNNSWFTNYGKSGISFYQAWNSDSNNSDYKMVITNNKSYNNRNFIPWSAVGKITDGNGIILDDFRNTQNKSTLGVYNGRTLVANNIVYNNGGSGIHSYYSNNIDIINNIAYLNNQTPELQDGQIYPNSSSNVNILNNIMVAPSGKGVNSNWNNTDVTYGFNTYNVTPKVVGNGDIVADPQFVDAAAFNFALKPTSPVRSRMIEKILTVGRR